MNKLIIEFSFYRLLNFPLKFYFACLPFNLDPLFGGFENKRLYGKYSIEIYLM